MGNETKERLPLRMKPETSRRLEQWYTADNCRSKNEFVEKAVNFYVDYLEMQDDRSLLPTALMAVQLALVADLAKKLGYKSCVLAGVLAALTGIQYFYATGHTPQISDIAFDAGFIGFERTHWAPGFVLVLLNTVGAPLLCLAALPLLRPPFEHYELRRWWLFVACLSFFAVSALALCATTLFIFLEPRHLMVWRVFCPRLLFDAGMTATYLLVGTLVILVVSINKLRW